ncbi:MAG: trigger factor [Victivallales bacterium]|nr:trigger factor [Victivallales bacterium]
MDLIRNIVKDSVKIEKEQLEPCLKQVDFTVPSDKVEAGYNKIAKAFAKEAKLQGFRPGKAPVSMVKQIYKKNIEEEMVKELCSIAFQPITEEFDMLSYNFADNKEPEVNLGSDFKFSLKINVAPEIQLPEYKGVKVELEKSDLKEEDITKRIDYFREIYGKFEKIDGVAEEGDMLKVSYSSSAVLPEDVKENIKNLVNSEENYIWLNKNQDMIPGINNALIGKKAGDEVNHTADFAEDFEEQALAGQTVDYKIKIEEVQRKVPLNSDEELCSKLMVKNLDELKDRIRTMAESELEQANSNIKKTKVVDKITENLDFPVPPGILQEAISNEFSNMVNEMMKAKKSEEEKAKVSEEIKQKREELMEEAKEKAEKRVKKFLLLRKIGKEENIEANEQELDKYIQQMSYYYGQKPEELKKRLVDTGNISQVYDEVLVNKVTDFLADNAEVTYMETKEESDK